jgi:hypothetical protein
VTVRSRHLLWLALAATFTVPCGCGADSRPHLHPLTGTVVSRGGERVTSGGLIFVLESGERTRLIVNAAVQPDGTFTARTERMDDRGTTILPGAPAGTYRAIYHPPSDGSKTDLAVDLPERVTVEAGGVAVSLTLPDQAKADANPDKN